MIILIITTIVIFLAMRLLPGDPILLVMTRSQERNFSQEQIAQLRHEHNLDKAIPLQYVDWISSVVRGDLGISIIKSTPVTKEIKRRLPITLYVGVLAFIVGNVVGIPAGLLCAVRRGSWVDVLVTALSNLGITMPVFWLGVLLIYVFSLHLNWFPVMGYISPFEDFWQSARHLVLPVICLAVFPIGSTARQTRSSVLEVMQQDYIRTAWAKGLRERIIVVHHAFRNCLIPIITLAGIGISMIIGGSVLVETVFNIPGMGRLLVSSVMDLDYPYTQAITLIIAAMVIFSNLVVDLTYGWLDPRIRYE